MFQKFFSKLSEIFVCFRIENKFIWTRQNSYRVPHVSGLERFLSCFNVLGMKIFPSIFRIYDWRNFHAVLLLLFLEKFKSKFTTSRLKNNFTLIHNLFELKGGTRIRQNVAWYHVTVISVLPSLISWRSADAHCFSRRFGILSLISSLYCLFRRLR